MGNEFIQLVKKVKLIGKKLDEKLCGNDCLPEISFNEFKNEK
jgi:hypothetical protein